MSFELKQILADRYGPLGSAAYDTSLEKLAWHYRASLEALTCEVVWARQSPARDILDLGTGTGNASAALFAALDSNVTRHWTGIDASPPMLKLAEQKLSPFQNLHTEYKCRTFESLTPNTWSECFDLIISSYAVHHLTHMQKNQLFSSILQWTRPGGMLVLLDRMPPLENSIHERQYHQVLASGMKSLFPPQAQPSIDNLAIALDRAFEEDGDIAESSSSHLQLLQKAGWQDLRMPFQSFGITLISAIKPKQPLGIVGPNNITLFC